MTEGLLTALSIRDDRDELKATAMTSILTQVSQIVLRIDSDYGDAGTLNTRASGTSNTPNGF